MTPPAILEEARRLGLVIRAEGDRLRVKPPDPKPTEWDRVVDELRRQKPAVLAALAASVEPANPCPTCGAMADELAAVRAKRAKDAAFDAWDAHARACGPCAWWNRKQVPEELRGNGERATGRMDRCPEAARLASAYFDAWTRWLAATGEEATVHEAC